VYNRSQIAFHPLLCSLGILTAQRITSAGMRSNGIALFAELLLIAPRKSPSLGPLNHPGTGMWRTGNPCGLNIVSNQGLGAAPTGLLRQAEKRHFGAAVRIKSGLLAY